MSEACASEIEWRNCLSTLLDSRFRIPGPPIRFGWDALLGLVPGAGDLAAFGPSACLIYKGHSRGARKRTILRRTANTVTDFVVGAVPVPGDVFAQNLKANYRKFALSRKDPADGNFRKEDFA